MKSIPIIICYALLPIATNSFTLNTQQGTSFHPTKSTLPNQKTTSAAFPTNNRSKNTNLSMKVDPITALRCEWISAALCTNQTPRDADVALQLGCNDGRAIMFLPKTIRKLITSSNESDGEISITIARQLNQQRSQRFGKPGESFGGGEISERLVIDMLNQRADDLKLVEDESVDVVLSLQSAENMQNNGLDWKQSIQEAIRVLKPQGRFLFVERTDLKYLEHLETQEGIFWESVDYDNVDLVVVPHLAGVAVKSIDAGLTDEERLSKAQQKEKDVEAEFAIKMFEGNGRRRKKKKKKKEITEDSAQ